jgi:methylated-DNA-protein-cysteine methyltransferase-like protein
MPDRKPPALFYQKVYALVRRIPAGQVTSYGRVAEMIGHQGAARQVGYAMSALKNRQDDPDYADVPWQRVVGHNGEIRIKGGAHSRSYQAELLQQEGVTVRQAADGGFVVEVETHMWEGLLPHEVDRLLAGLSSGR